MKNNRYLILLFVIFGILILAGLSIWIYMRPAPVQAFNGQRAYADVVTQVAFGPRTVGSDAHKKFIVWLQDSLDNAGWQNEIQEAEMMGHPIQNIIATRGTQTPRILFLAHYDSRLLADNDPNPDNHTQAVPGANDGASGVAVLLELARTLPKDTLPVGLIFLDAEDNGNIEGWDWILGSRAYVKTMDYKPAAVILVDMIGDKDLNIYYERNSDKDLTNQIWDTAKSLGYEQYFIPIYKFSVLDDHTPFIEAGIPALDIIDLDYSYWHTISDTPDKVSPESLEAVGKTLLTWLVKQK
jgi:glutaminyl-peptide cyclotransferase